MDVGGSFLELSCARIALVPVGSAITELQFEELVSHLHSCREVPLAALPRRAALSRPTGSATLSSMPEAFRKAMQSNSAPVLTRSRSAGRDFTRLQRRVENSTSTTEESSEPKDASDDSSEDMTERMKTIASVNIPKLSESEPSTQHIPPTSYGAESVDESEPSNSALRKLGSRPEEQDLRPSCGELDLSSADVASSFRMRFDPLRRDSRGALLLKSPSEWDEFHSTRTWGVIGICDVSDDDNREKESRLKNVYSDFSNLLQHFKNAPIRRLMVLASSDTSRASPSSLLPEMAVSSLNGGRQVPFSVGFIPGNLTGYETKLEIRAQVTHIAGLLIASIDRDCWKRRESPQSELFLSPIDERHSADRQSKLAKRRAGRLDKLLADSLLLMGSPREALTKYNSAIERAKASSDRLWLAGAMEGWSAAHVLSHIGSGGNVDDADLTDMLVEHYNEIYKLYQKKRAAEPEAGAALRLAEYLGTWTSRRKDALHAAQHASIVGEGLTAQKRASLWEALARFSERMGCRRKAALFLYRLGHFNASQSSWSSAMELMLASEEQMVRRGNKPWAALSRQILLKAAKYAEEANDSSTAAKLLIEALAVSPSPKGSADTNENVMVALQRAQIPSFIPGCNRIVEVVALNPLNLHGSSFKAKSPKNVPAVAESEDASGPFIYNPFEAKKKAKAAAVARQTITWVCGEQAQVSLALRSRVGAKLIIELISVLFADEDGDDALGSPNSPGNSLNEEETINVSKEHSSKVREALETSARLVKTISESVQVESNTPVVKSIAVVPKRPGRLTVKGILVRLFGGALVIVRPRSASDRERSLVNVLPELPLLSLVCPSSGDASAETFHGRRAPISVLDGETRKVNIGIRNTGKDKISLISAKVDVSDGNFFSTHVEGLQSADLLQALQRPGSNYTAVVSFRRDLQSVMVAGEDTISSRCNEHKGSCMVTLTVQYEGCSVPGIVRESRASMKISSEPVIRVDRVRRMRCGLLSSAGGGSGPLVAVELSNLVSVPAGVNLWESNNELESHKASHRVVGRPAAAHNGCLLESGASVRLVQPGTLENSSGSDEMKQQEGLNDGNSCLTSWNCRVDWTLPAFGRHGFIDLFPPQNFGSPLMKLASSQNPAESRPQINLLPRDLHGRELLVETLEMRNSCTVQVGTFVTIVARLKLDSSVSAKPSELDVTVESRVTKSVRGQQCISLVGACRHVPINLLQRNEEFLEHRFRVRVSSVGTFCIHVSLREKGSLLADSADEWIGSKSVARLDAHNKRGTPKEEVRQGQAPPPVQTAGSRQGNTKVSWVAGPAEESKDLSMSSELRRLDLNPSIPVIHPKTVDMYQSDNQRSSPALIATSSLTLKVVSSAN